MKLGENIKYYRRMRDITQEELAEMLNVSPQAVSHWECGRTVPDVTQLPILANIFEVTTDTLLGVDIASKENRIDEIRKEAMSRTRREAMEIYRSALIEYPDSYLLMSDYAWELYHSSSSEEFADKNGKIVAAYIDRILQNCTDTSVRNSVIDLACRAFPKLGRTNEALKLAESMDGAVTKLELLPAILTGKKRLDAMRDCIIYYLTRSLYDIVDYVSEEDENGQYYFADEDRIAVLEKVLCMYKLIYEDGDYLFEAQCVEQAYKAAARYYATHGNIEKTVEYAEESAKCAIQFDTYPAGERHTSLLLRGKEAEGIWWDDEHNRSFDLLNSYLTDKAFDLCRKDKRFCGMLKMLEGVAR